MSFYLDASVLVALITPEPLSPRSERFLAANPDLYIISNFAAAEFASAISRRVRIYGMTSADGQSALASLDSWIARSAEWIEIVSGDVERASIYLRRLDLPLLMPDAIHIAVAHRLGATLVTLDRQMAANARSLTVAVAEP